MSAYGVMTVNWVELRYFNVITIEQGDPLDWGNLLADSLTSMISFLKDKSILSRAMNTINLNKSDYKIALRSGLFNSEFPSTLARKEFVLDYECYSDDEKEIDQISGLIRVFHDEIAGLFEASIKDGLREIIGEIKNGL